MGAQLYTSHLGLMSKVEVLLAHINLGVVLLVREIILVQLLG
jgi:hypothetical protein